MNFLQLEKKARENLKGFCRVCPECDGYACAGEVPGMGGAGTAASFKNNIRDLKKIRLKLKTIHDAKDPNMERVLFGQKLSFPVMVAPITGSALNMGGALGEKEYIQSVVQGSENVGTIGMIGDSADLTLYDEGLRALKKVEGRGVAIIKPRSNGDIIQNIKKAEDIGIPAVGVDIDGAGLITMALKGQPVGPKTIEELKEIIQATELPVVLKGIMTSEEAEIAVSIGAKAIVVSNHGGRVLDHADSTAEVLPDIAEKVGDKIMILADGGVRSGVDVFKMIALGAHGVLVGRPIVMGAFGGFEEGVTMVLEKLKQEFYQAMILTGASDLKDINRDKIRIT